MSETVAPSAATNPSGALGVLMAPKHLQPSPSPPIHSLDVSSSSVKPRLLRELSIQRRILSLLSHAGSGPGLLPLPLPSRVPLSVPYPFTLKDDLVSGFELAQLMAYLSNVPHPHTHLSNN